MDGDLGELAYAIAVLIMSAAAGIAGHLKKKKKRAELQEHQRGPSRALKPTPRPAPTPGRMTELPADPAELIEMILRRKAAEPPSPPARGQPPTVQPPIRPARATEPPRPARPASRPTARPERSRRVAAGAPEQPEIRGLSALGNETVVIDSIEHARHVSTEAERLGRTAEEHARLLQQRLLERRFTGPGSITARRVADRQRTGQPRYTPAALRQAVIFKEILGKPVALREDPES